MKKAVASLVLCVTFGLSAFINAFEAGGWVVRGGVTLVDPDGGSSAVFFDGADSGLSVSVEDDTQLGINLVYFFSRSWAIELLAATPFSHEIQLDGAGKLANVDHLPPTLSALYYLPVGDTVFRPYVGAGLNYTIFFDEDLAGAFRDAGFQNLELDDSIGAALQVGADFVLDENWSLNASIRYIDIETEATFQVDTGAGIASGKTDAKIDPYVFTLAVGYTFH